MTNTLSTAQEQLISSTLPKNTPVDIDNNPIKFDGNPAHAEGVLFEVQKFWTRKGMFQTLLKTGTVLLSSGKQAIDSLDAVPFLTGQISYDTDHGFNEPCPPTPKRVELFESYARRQTAAGLTPPVFQAPRTMDPGSNLIVSLPSIEAEQTRLLDSLIQVIEPTDIAGDLSDEAAGNGIKLIQLMRDFRHEVQPGDRALVRTEYDRTVATGLAGAELELKSFNAFIKRLLSSNRHMYPNLKSDDELSMVIQQIIYRDRQVREQFDVACIVKDPSEGDFSLAGTQPDFYRFSC